MQDYRKGTLDELQKQHDELKKRVAWLEHEFEALGRRIHSETDHKIQGMLGSIEHLVSAHTTETRTQVQNMARELSEARKEISKIDTILEIVRKLEVKEKVEEQAELLLEERQAKEDAALARKLEVVGKISEIQVQKTTAIDSRIDGNHKRRVAYWTLVVTLLVALLGGGTCTALSHFSSTQFANPSPPSILPDGGSFQK